MSTELAVVPPLVDLPEPLSEGAAKKLDKRIRQASIRVADEHATLLDLLEEAAVGQAHIALGFRSWTEYVKDAVSVSPADAAERKALVSLMNGKGMSQQAIADVVGVDQATISRDLSGNTDGPAESTGIDGKTYKKPKPKKDDIIDVEVVDLPEPTPKVPPVSQDFRDEMWNLINTVAAFNDIAEDERFPKAVKTIAKNNLNKLTGAITELQAIVDLLMQ